MNKALPRIATVLILLLAGTAAYFFLSKPATKTPDAVTKPTAKNVETKETGPEGVANAPVITETTPGVKTFTSPKLGISFQFLTSQGGMTVNTTQLGDKVYVYTSNTKPTDGQWIQVIYKNQDQPLVDAIRQKFLPVAYKESDCRVKTTNDQPGFETAQIQVAKTANGDMEALSKASTKCPEVYTTTNGISYFLTDSKHPKEFFYLSIGQYEIVAPGNKPWQNTLKVL